MKQAPRQGREAKALATGVAGWQRLANHAAGIAMLPVGNERHAFEAACYGALVTRFVQRSRHA